jgi:hypothetical protein
VTTKQFVRTAQQALEQQRHDHEPNGFVHRTRALAAALPPVPESESKMKKDDLWPSRFLKAADFPEPRVLTIKKTRLETLKNKSGEDEKLVVYFVEEGRGLALNRVNFDSICDAAGQDDSNRWPTSMKIELYATTTTMNGDTVPCVRVRAPTAAQPTAKPAARKPAPARKPKPPPEDDDELPKAFR